MRAFFASGHAVDLVLAVMLIEWVVLLVRRQKIIPTTLALLPGALILLALRAALTQAPWPWIAAALAASLPVHLLDLRRRGL